MTTISLTAPPAVRVEQLPDGSAEIVLCAEPQPCEEGVAHTLYVLRRPWREGLAQDVEQAFEAWCAMAAQEEGLAGGAQVPTPEQRLAQLERENELLAAAMEELIFAAMGGEA